MLVNNKPTNAEDPQKRAIVGFFIGTNKNIAAKLIPERPQLIPSKTEPIISFRFSFRVGFEIWVEKIGVKLYYET